MPPFVHSQRRPPTRPRTDRKPSNEPRRPSASRHPRRHADDLNREQAGLASGALAVPAGFLGSRADLLTDLAPLTFIVLPLVMPLGFRLARKRRYLSHRRVQIGFLCVMTVAVLMLEIDVRLRGGSGALAGQAVAIRDSPPGCCCRCIF